MMSGPEDIRLVWESRALSCMTATSGGGGGDHVPEAELGKFSLALATLGSGRVLRFKEII